MADRKLSDSAYTAMMLSAYSSPVDEARRLAALAALGPIFDGPGAGFSALVAMAARFADCPAAMLNLVDRDHQSTVAGHGIPVGNLPRALTLCDHAIRGRDLMIVPDAREDLRFRDNPLVIEHALRFYAGVPIHAPDLDGERQAIGTICVLDTTPRALTSQAADALRELATVAEALIVARGKANECERQTERLARQEQILLQAERMAMIGSWRLTLNDDNVEWSDNVYRIHDLPIGEQPALGAALDFYPPDARAVVSGALARLIDGGHPLDIETDFVTATGNLRRVRSIAELEQQDGLPVAIIGIVQDVTERHALEQALRRSADRDELTGIANRAAFNRLLEAAMESAHRAGTPLLLALIDLDGFKTINDTLGHMAGDDVLKVIGRRLTEPWLGGSVAARLGGDEFALVVTAPAFTADPSGFTARLESALSGPVHANGLTIQAEGTVGTAMLTPDVTTVRDFVHRADNEMYIAKRVRVGERRRSQRRAV